jgi:thiamine-monophosphate kinase
VDSAALPLSAALRAFAGPAHARELALSGGEDYVLLLAVPRRRTAAFERAMARAHLFCADIGALSPGARVLVDGKVSPLRGFRHFGRSLRRGLRTSPR